MKLVGQGTILSERMKRIIATGKFENNGGAVNDPKLLTEAAKELFNSEKETISNFLDQMKSEK